MSDSFFLDTSIFVYSFDSANPVKSLRAKELIRDALASGKGVISYQVVQAFLNAALRRFSRPMTTPEAEQYLSIPRVPLLAVQSSRALFAQALRNSRDYSVIWYDSIILAAAIEARCGVLYSEDLQHGQKFSNLRVVNPFLRLSVLSRLRRRNLPQSCFHLPNENRRARAPHARHRASLTLCAPWIYLRRPLPEFVRQCCLDCSSLFGLIALEERPYEVREFAPVFLSSRFAPGTALPKQPISGPLESIVHEMLFL